MNLDHPECVFHQISAKKTHYLATLKLIPQWVSLFLLKSGLGHLASSVFRLSGTCATDLVNTLTSNKDLQVIFAYLFYGEFQKEENIVVENKATEFSLVFNKSETFGWFKLDILCIFRCASKGL